jgi:hypothetical protein
MVDAEFENRSRRHSEFIFHRKMTAEEQKTFLKQIFRGFKETLVQIELDVPRRFSPAEFAKGTMRTVFAEMGANAK